MALSPFAASLGAVALAVVTGPEPALAFPAMQVTSSVGNLVARELDYENIDTKSRAMCEFNIDSDSETSERDRYNLWKNTGAGKVMDDFISENGSDATGMGWLNEYVIFMYGNSDEMKCDTLSDDCKQPKDCYTMHRDGKGVEWLVLMGISKAHKILKHVKETLFQDGAIDTLLSVDEIAADFEEPEESGISDEQTQSMLGSAVGAGAGFLGLSPATSALGPVMALGGAVMGASAVADPSEPPDEPDMAGIKALAHRFFSSVRTSCDDLLNRINGNGDQRKIPNAGQSEQDIYKNGVARMFASGQWLADTDWEPLENWMDASIKYLKQALAVEVIAQRGFHVMLWDGLDDEKECGGLGMKGTSPFKTARWMGDLDEPGCYLIGSFDNTGPQMHPYGPIDAHQKWPESLGEKNSATLQDKYEVDLRDLFTNVHNCKHLKQQKEDIDEEKLMDWSAGPPPPCLYPIPFKKVKYHFADAPDDGFRTVWDYDNDRAGQAHHTNQD